LQQERPARCDAARRRDWQIDIEQNCQYPTVQHDRLPSAAAIAAVNWGASSRKEIRRLDRDIRQTSPISESAMIR
jgi:hypothetical protein